MTSHQINQIMPFQSSQSSVAHWFLQIFRFTQTLLRTVSLDYLIKKFTVNLDEDEALIVYYDDSEKGVAIYNWTLTVDSGIFSTEFLNGFTMRYSTVDVSTTIFGFRIRPDKWYDGEPGNLILFEGNEFTGKNEKAVEEFFDINYGGDVSFSENVFLTGFNNSVGFLDSLLVMRSTCSDIGNSYTQQIVLRNNIFSELEGLNSGFKISYFDDSVTILRNSKKFV